VSVNDHQQINISVTTIDVAFLPLLKIPIVQGRNFSDNFPTDSLRSVLVNETFASEAGWKQPIGQKVTMFDGNEDYTVVGVVKDYHYRPLTEIIKPQIFTMKFANPYGMAYIKLKPGNTKANLDFVEKTFRKLFPLTAFAYNFIDQQNEASYRAEEKWKQILLFSALLTIFISCIGLFGLSVLSAEKRTKEIGVRKVLGASVSNIATALSIDFLKLICIALIISIPVAWMATSKWLQNYPYRISPNGWLFVAAGLLVILLALVTVSFQAIKAALANPVESLRAE
jgi:putative ABC transport system permease protein